MTTQNKMFPCPECGKEFKAPTARGMHRRLAHGIEGQSTSAQKYREEKGVPDVKETQLTVSSKAKPEPVKRAYVKKQSSNSQDDGDNRLQAAATFAAGRITQLLESLALQHDLPPRTLTSLVLRVVHSQTVR